MFTFRQYIPVLTEDLEHVEEKSPNFEVNTNQQWTKRRKWLITVIIIVVSNLCTWALTFLCLHSQTSKVIHHHHPCKSQGNVNQDILDVTASFNNEVPFFGRDDKTNSVFNAWENINIDNGVIAISEAEALALGLPMGDPFFWDRSKRLYVLQGHHALHCVKKVFMSIHEYRTGQPQSEQWAHILHCLDAMRQNIICQADDTPLWMHQYGQEGGTFGFNQTRQCHSWDRLENWAKQRTACYSTKPRDGVSSDMEALSRMTYCPDDRYQKQIEKKFGRSFV